MILLDFNQTAGAALRSGILKGMAAPVMLFGRFELPEQHSPEAINLHRIAPMKSMADDFAKISSDLARSLKKL